MNLNNENPIRSVGAIFFGTLGSIFLIGNLVTHNISDAVLILISYLFYLIWCYIIFDKIRYSVYRKFKFSGNSNYEIFRNYGGCDVLKAMGKPLGIEFIGKLIYSHKDNRNKLNYAIFKLKSSNEYIKINFYDNICRYTGYEKHNSLEEIVTKENYSFFKKKYKIIKSEWENIIVYEKLN